MCTKAAFFSAAKAVGVAIEETKDPVTSEVEYFAWAPDGKMFADHGTTCLSLAIYWPGEKRNWRAMIEDLALSPNTAQ